MVNSLYPNSPMQIKVEVIGVNQWVGMSVVDRLQFIKENRYQDILFIYPSDQYDGNKERLFKQFLNYFSDVKYAEQKMEFLEDQFGRLYAKNWIVPPQEVRSALDILRAVREYDGYGSGKHLCQFLRYIMNGYIFSWVQELGWKEIMYGEDIYPYAPGIPYDAPLPLFEERLKMNALLIIPDVGLKDTKLIKEHYDRIFNEQLEIGLESTILYKYSSAIGQANIRKEFDEKGVDWRSLHALVRERFAPEATEEQNKLYETMIRRRGVLTEKVLDQELVAKFHEMSLNDKYDFYNKMYVTWKDYYDKDKLQGNEPDHFDRCGGKLKFTYDAQFKQSMRKEYPFLNVRGGDNLGVFLSSYASYVIDGIEYGDKFVEYARRYWEMYRWAHGLEAVNKLTDVLGGEKVWPSLYTKPDVYKNIPIKPDKLSIFDYTPDIKKLSDIPEHEWDAQYKKKLENDIVDINDVSYMSYDSTSN